MPSDRLLRLVANKHKTYLVDGGKVTQAMLNDPESDLEVLTEQLIGEFGEKYLVKVGKGWDLRELTKLSIPYLRSYQLEEKLDVGNKSKRAKAKEKARKAKLAKKAGKSPTSRVRPPRTRKVLDFRKKHGQQSVAIDLEPVNRKEPDALSIVRTALTGRLNAHPEWRERLCEESPDEARRSLRTLLNTEFINKLEARLESRTLVWNHLDTVLGEIHRAHRGPQVSIPKQRRSTRETTSPRRISSMKRAA